MKIRFILSFQVTLKDGFCKFVYFLVISKILVADSFSSVKRIFLGVCFTSHWFVYSSKVDINGWPWVVGRSPGSLPPAVSEWFPCPQPRSAPCWLSDPTRTWLPRVGVGVGEAEPNRQGSPLPQSPEPLPCHPAFSLASPREELFSYRVRNIGTGWKHQSVRSTPDNWGLSGMKAEYCVMRLGFFWFQASLWGKKLCGYPQKIRKRVWPPK